MIENDSFDTGIDIMLFDIGRIIVIDDTRQDVTQLRSQRGTRGPYLQAHQLVMSNIEAMSTDISRVFGLSFSSILLGLNNSAITAPNSTIYSSMLNLFSLMDQCAVFANNKLGEIDLPENAVYFGKNSKRTATSIANSVPNSQATQFLNSFGYIEKGRDHDDKIQHADEEDWHRILTILRGRIVHRQALLFKSDLQSISRFIQESGYKMNERNTYVTNFSDVNVQAFDFMCFLLFASEKLTSLIRLCQYL